MNSKSAVKMVALGVALLAMTGYVVFVLTGMARSSAAKTNLAVLAAALGIGALAAGLGLAGLRK